MSAGELSNARQLLRVGLGYARQLRRGFREPLLPRRKLALSARFQFFESKTQLLCCFVDAHTLNRVQIHFLPELENLDAGHGNAAVAHTRKQCHLHIAGACFQLKKFGFFGLSTFAQSDVFATKSNLISTSKPGRRTARQTTHAPAAVSETTSPLRARRCGCGAATGRRG